jgi:hypothetical protein
MNTLLLNPASWDLLADANGNIAMAAPPYAVAQDVASATATFIGEVYFDTTQGLPYFNEILGQRPSLSFIKAKVNSAALTVPTVVTANTAFVSLVNRTLSGQVQVTDKQGSMLAINLNNGTSSFFILDQSDLDSGILG